MRVKLTSVTNKIHKVQSEEGKVYEMEQENCYDFNGASDVDDMCEMTVLN